MAWRRFLMLVDERRCRFEKVGLCMCKWYRGELRLGSMKSGWWCCEDLISVVLDTRP